MMEKVTGGTEMLEQISLTSWTSLSWHLGAVGRYCIHSGEARPFVDISSQHRTLFRVKCTKVFRAIENT